MHPLLRTVLQRLGLGLHHAVCRVARSSSRRIEMLPGDFAKAILGQSATPETVEAFQKEIGLDQPAVERYFDWIGGVLQGDFGSSYAGARRLHRRTVSSTSSRRASTTLSSSPA